MRARYPLIHALLLAESVTGDPQRFSGPGIQQRQSCPAPGVGSPKTWWRAEIAHDGVTPYSTDLAFQYYRNVLSYGADNTGIKDSSKAFNEAVHGE